MSQFRVGDPIVYHKPKRSVSPGPRARQIYPLEHGEHYHYVVDKFWKVFSIKGDGTIEVVTRTGKKHVLPVSDPNLHKAYPFQLFLNRKRFPN